jgi:Flp pilus assembly protein TadG
VAVVRAKKINGMKAAGAPRGLAAVETAIMLPLILMLTMAVMEYGWMFIMHQHVANAARQGARVGAKFGVPTTAAIDAVKQAMDRAGIGDTGYQVEQELTTLPVGINVSMLTVTVKLNYSEVGLGLPLIPKPQMLSASFTMARESQ